MLRKDEGPSTESRAVGVA